MSALKNSKALIGRVVDGSLEVGQPMLVQTEYGTVQTSPVESFTHHPNGMTAVQTRNSAYVVIAPYDNSGFGVQAGPLSAPLSEVEKR